MWTRPPTLASQDEEQPLTAAGMQLKERKTGAGGRAQGGGVGGHTQPTAADLQVLSEANGWMDGGWIHSFI